MSVMSHYRRGVVGAVHPAESGDLSLEGRTSPASRCRSRPRGLQLEDLCAELCSSVGSLLAAQRRAVHRWTPATAMPRQASGTWRVAAGPAEAAHKIPPLCSIRHFRPQSFVCRIKVLDSGGAWLPQRERDQPCRSSHGEDENSHGTRNFSSSPGGWLPSRIDGIERTQRQAGCPISLEGCDCGGECRG